jgi:GH24 family phage-related lysozyme (muramidase)
LAKPWSKVRAFLRRHEKAEEELGVAAGAVALWQVLAAVGIVGAGVACAAVLSTSTYHPSYPLSPKATAFIERHEGVRYHPYQDPSGIAACTVGAGHVLGWRYCTAADLRETFTPAQVRAFLVHDTGGARACITSRITHYVTQYEYEALVDLVFNAGCGSLYYRNVAGLVNAGAFSRVPYALSTTATTAGGRFLAGLYQRRIDEGVLFSRGYYGAGIGYFVAPKPLTKAQRAEHALRAKTGYWSWLAWYLHEGRWHAYAVHATIVRPHVPARIPSAWWRRERIFVKARA